jgi:hypothetical protein
MAMAALFLDSTGIAGRQENGLSCSAFPSIYLKAIILPKTGSGQTQRKQHSKGEPWFSDRFRPEV